MSTDIMTDPAKDCNFDFSDLKCKGKDCEIHTAHSHLKCKNVCFVCFPFQVLNASPLRNFCRFSFQLEEKHQPTLPLKVLWMVCVSLTEMEMARSQLLNCDMFSQDLVG